MKKESLKKPGAVEYRMPEVMAKEILKDRKNRNPQEFLIEYVNRECGLKNLCTKVSLY